MQNFVQGRSEIWFQSYRDFSLLLIAYSETPLGLRKFSKNRKKLSYKILEPLKRVQKNFEVIPSLGSKIIVIFRFRLQ